MSRLLNYLASPLPHTVPLTPVMNLLLVLHKMGLQLGD
jgi:hypothetical protein